MLTLHKITAITVFHVLKTFNSPKYERKKGRNIVKKKLLTLVLTTVTVTSLLSGCGSGTQTNETDTTESSMGEAETLESQNGEQLESGKVTLTVWAEESNHEMLAQMIENFKQKYAGQADFEINLAVQGDDTLKDVMLGDIHSAADVFSFPDDQLTSLVAAGALVPVPNADEVSSANLEESVEAASCNGILYAYPMTADNGYFMYYDKNYFTDEDVKTLDGMLAVAEAAGKQISMEFTSGWYLYSFFGQTGLEFGLNEDGVTNYCNWNSTEGSIKGTDIVQALYQITSSPAFISEGNDDFIAGVKEGRVIAGISGVWNAMEIKDAWGADYGAVKLPTYTCAGQQVQMSSFTGYKMMGVNYYSEHKEWACKLAGWLTNEENQTIRFQQRNQGPSNINAAASDEVGKVPAIAAVIDQGQYGRLQRVGNSYWNACTKFANTILDGQEDGKKPQEIIDTLVDGITASAVG